MSPLIFHTFRPLRCVKGSLCTEFIELIRSQKISGYLPEDDGLKHALTGADVVVIPAGIPRTFLTRKVRIEDGQGG